MPEGQYTGQKAIYEYTADSGETYLLSLDATLGDIAECNLTKANTNTTGLPKPLRFKPRVVFWQGTLDGRQVRKSLVCETDSTLYETDKSSSLTIDGVTGKTTGRRGETFSYLNLSDPTPT